MKDPVCGMRIDSGAVRLVSTHKGQAYYFCAAPCQSSFDKDPEKYLRPKGLFNRLLRRLARSNEKAFGPKGPSCCR